MGVSARKGADGQVDEGGEADRRTGGQANGGGRARMDSRKVKLLN